MLCRWAVMITKRHDRRSGFDSRMPGASVGPLLFAIPFDPFCRTSGGEIPGRCDDGSRGLSVPWLFGYGRVSELAADVRSRRAAVRI